MRTQIFVLFAALAVPSFARADIPPPKDYVEKCTVEKQSGSGRVCHDCRSYFGNPPDYCAKVLGGGLTYACKTYGASVWTEVWCSGDAGVVDAGGVSAADAGDVSAADAGDAGAADAGAPSTAAPDSKIDDGGTAPLPPLAASMNTGSVSDPSATDSGCNASGLGASSFPGLLALAGLLATRRRRRSH